MRKPKNTGEITVMEVAQLSVGVLTRAKSLALQKLKKSTSSSYLDLRTPILKKERVSTPSKSRENCRRNPVLSSSSKPNPSPKSQSFVSSFNSDANLSGSTSFLKMMEEGFAENDLGLEFDPHERNMRESTPCSMVSDCGRLSTHESAMDQAYSTKVAIHGVISTSELEEFFANAEHEQQRIFMEKYNYDPVNDVPLSGRYEWLKLNA